MDARLLNTAKQDVFELIKQNELDPLAFQWKQTKSPDDLISMLFFKSHSTYYFVFDVITKANGGLGAPLLKAVEIFGLTARDGQHCLG
jgi:hypothetical protein